MNTKYVGKHNIGDNINDNRIASLQCDNINDVIVPCGCLAKNKKHNIIYLLCKDNNYKYSAKSINYQCNHKKNLQY